MVEEEKCSPTIECDSPAVNSYLNILQSVINRMASNSAACKTWCITLVSAIIVVLIDKDKGQYIYVAIAPSILFALLDSYYLAMEKSFRDRYNSFIKKLHTGIVDKKDLFVVSPEVAVKSSQIKDSIKSISIYPFYLALIALIIVIGFVASDIAASGVFNFINNIKGG